jgi:hypothetical protein
VKLIVLPALFTTILSVSAFAQDKTAGGPPPYVLHQGTIGGVSTTILMEQSTGTMWYLAQVDKDGGVWVVAPSGAVGVKPAWAPLAFLNTTQKPVAPPH